MKRILSIQSHVVFGCAGNSAAVFPMRRLGMEVWPINTVQFSNHTQYEAGWQGMAMPAGHIAALCQGLCNIEVLARCDAVLSGYLGSAEQGDEILAVGGSRPALASFRAFRGRDPQIDALLRHSGMSEPATA